MNVVLTGPFDTDAFRSLTGLSLAGAPAGMGGIPMTDLAARLRQKGLGVTVVTLDATIDDTLRIESDGIAVVYCPLRGAPRYRARTRILDLFELEIRHLTREIRNARPDIVHAHWTYEFAEAAVRSRRPHVVTMHDLGWQCLSLYRDPYRAIRLLMKYRVMPRIRALTVVAPFMTTKSRNYGYFGPVDVVPNGVAIPPPRSPEHIGDLAKPRIVTVGDQHRIKNIRASVDAFRIVRDAVPGAELHIFGPGLNAGFVDGEPSVVGHGLVAHSELMAFLAQQATVLVHPSRLESFGITIVEAKARQVPVVAGRSSGGVSYVCDDRVSRLVDINDPKSIAEATLEFLSSPKVYRDAGIHSRQDVAKRFSSDAAADAYLEVYAKVLSNFVA